MGKKLNAEMRAALSDLLEDVDQFFVDKPDEIAGFDRVIREALIAGRDDGDCPMCVIGDAYAMLYCTQCVDIDDKVEYIKWLAHLIGRIDRRRNEARGRDDAGATVGLVDEEGDERPARLH